MWAYYRRIIHLFHGISVFDELSIHNDGQIKQRASNCFDGSLLYLNERQKIKNRKK